MKNELSVTELVNRLVAFETANQMVCSDAGPNIFSIGELDRQALEKLIGKFRFITDYLVVFECEHDRGAIRYSIIELIDHGIFLGRSSYGPLDLSDCDSDTGPTDWTVFKYENITRKEYIPTAAIAPDARAVEETIKNFNLKLTEEQYPRILRRMMREYNFSNEEYAVLRYCNRKFLKI